MGFVFVFNFYLTSAALVSIYLTKYREGTGKKVPLCFPATSYLCPTLCLRLSFWLWPGISGVNAPASRQGHSHTLPTPRTCSLWNVLERWVAGPPLQPLHIQQALVYGNLSFCLSWMPQTLVEGPSQLTELPFIVRLFPVVVYSFSEEQRII